MGWTRGRPFLLPCGEPSPCPPLALLPPPIRRSLVLGLHVAFGGIKGCLGTSGEHRGASPTRAAPEALCSTLSPHQGLRCSVWGLQCWQGGWEHRLWGSGHARLRRVPGLPSTGFCRDRGPQCRFLSEGQEGRVCQLCWCWAFRRGAGKEHPCPAGPSACAGLCGNVRGQPSPTPAGPWVCLGQWGRWWPARRRGGWAGPGGGRQGECSHCGGNRCTWGRLCPQQNSRSRPWGPGGGGRGRLLEELHSSGGITPNTQRHQGKATEAGVLTHRVMG